MVDKISIIYKDKNFLAVYKPAGLLVHQAKLRIKNAELRIKESALADWLVKNYPEVKNVGDHSTGSRRINLRPGIVHRLDKDTSGVILIARNQKYFEYLKNLFQTRQIKKTYLALVYGQLKPKTGLINKAIRLKSGSVKRTIWRGKDEKGALTKYGVIKLFNIKKTATNFHDRENLLQFSLVEVEPKTGRTHQIRLHLASIGHPIVGDSLYGPKENPFGLKRQFLHAQSLEFNVAEGKRIKIEAELPEELKAVLRIYNL